HLCIEGGWTSEPYHIGWIQRIFSSRIQLQQEDRLHRNNTGRVNAALNQYIKKSRRGKTIQHIKSSAHRVRGCTDVSGAVTGGSGGEDQVGIKRKILVYRIKTRIGARFKDGRARWFGPLLASSLLPQP